MKSKSPRSEGRFAYEGLDRVIHERARLSVLTSLITNPKGLPFNDLKQLCALTDGNLSRHLSVLKMPRWSRSFAAMIATARKQSAVSLLRDASATSNTLRHWNRWCAMPPEPPSLTQQSPPYCKPSRLREPKIFCTLTLQCKANNVRGRKRT